MLLQKAGAVLGLLIASALSIPFFIAGDVLITRGLETTSELFLGVMLPLIGILNLIMVFHRFHRSMKMLS